MKLRKLIREVRSEDPTLSNRGDIARAVLARVTLDNLPDALKQALPAYVDEVLGEERLSHPLTPNAAMDEPISPQSSPVRPGYSAKGAAIRDAWRRALEILVHGEDGSYVRLGDCTVENLQYAADELDEQAVRCAAKAEAYRTFRKLIEAHQVERVRDLPEDVLRLSLGGSA